MFTKKSTLSVLFGLCSLGVYADSTTYFIPSESATNLYYDLGGTNIPATNVSDDNTIDVDFGVNSNIGFNCNNFNSAISISNSMNNIEDGAMGLAGDIINSATTAVISMPMYFLQRANPDIYNIIQNGLDLFNDKFKTNVASCQKALDNISNGKSDIQSYVNISDSQGWLDGARDAQGGGSVDVNNLEKQSAKDSGTKGIPWFCGKNEGGSKSNNQHPIEVINDVIRAGYNQYTGSSDNLCNENSPPSSVHTLITKFFKKPQDAQDWAVKIVGETTVSTDSTADKATSNYSSPGISLTDYQLNCDVDDGSCYKNVVTDLQNIVNSKTPPSQIDNDKLERVSSSQTAISPLVVEAIRSMRTAPERTISITRLANDVSLQNTIDKALSVKQMLSGGRNTKVIQNFKFSSTIKNAIDNLNEQINSLLQVKELRAISTTNTAQVILANYAKQKAKSYQTVGADSSSPIIDGAKLAPTKQYNPDI